MHSFLSFVRLATALLVVLTLLLLTACSSKSVHTVRVIDTPETRELPGWQRPYEVDGVRYQPLRDHQGFRERGIASWYGREFHGLKTSNGEVYDMYGLSAAHKTLPMGTSVKVIHLATGKEISVRINDRGPFVAGRIIDLSYGAARQLGIDETGLGEVEIVAVSGTYVPPQRSSVALSNSYAIQVAAFSVVDNAQQLANQMQTRFGKAQVATALVNGQPVYRVRVGDFTTFESAEQIANQLIAEGYSGSFIVVFE